MIKQLVARQYWSIDTVDITDPYCQSIDSIDLPSTANSMNMLIMFIDRIDAQHRSIATDQQLMFDLDSWFIAYVRTFRSFPTGRNSVASVLQICVRRNIPETWRHVSVSRHFGYKGANMSCKNVSKMSRDMSRHVCVATSPGQKFECLSLDNSN